VTDELNDLNKAKEKGKPEKKKPEKKAKDGKKGKKSSNNKYPVPYLLEVVMTVSKAIVVFVGIIVALISILGGSSPIWIMIRTAVAVISVGVLLWIGTSIAAKGIIEAETERVKREQEEADKAASTMELEA
jgi:hypothetical protein